MCIQHMNIPKRNSFILYLLSINVKNARKKCRKQAYKIVPQENKEKNDEEQKKNEVGKRTHNLFPLGPVLPLLNYSNKWKGKHREYWL